MSIVKGLGDRWQIIETCSYLQHRTGNWLPVDTLDLKDSRLAEVSECTTGGTCHLQYKFTDLPDTK